ncbi:hypothetical protein KM043_004347 [Ampulex compressa]|nr:hypothetical protein KM043_004347 [Ampulex compressa]
MRGGTRRRKPREQDNGGHAARPASTGPCSDEVGPGSHNATTSLPPFLPFYFPPPRPRAASRIRGVPRLS